MVQWLRHCVSIAKGGGLSPDQGTKIPTSALCSLKKKEKENKFTTYVFLVLALREQLLKFKCRFIKTYKGLDWGVNVLF